MKQRIKIFCMICCVLMAGAAFGAEEGSEGHAKPAESRQRLSASVDFLGSGPMLSLNAEYSPNRYLDFGMGITPFGFMLIPAAEVHFFARACFIDYFIQPYVQLGVSFVAPGQIDLNQNWLNARAGAGVKFSFAQNFYCGAGADYSFVGQNLTPLSWNGLYPSVFLGYTFLRF